MHYFSFAAPFWGLAAFAAASSCCCKAAKQCPVADVSALRDTGNPVGKTTVFENVTMYYTGDQKDAGGTAVLFLTDIYGIASPEDLRLADSFGRAGYFTVAPDLFNGSPSPLDMNAPGFNQTQFLAAHGPDVTDPIVAKGIRYLREVRGAQHVAIAGYCFGGRYALRFAGNLTAGENQGVDAVFAGHPAGWSDEEIADITLPASVAQGQNDELNPQALRQEMEDILDNKTTPWQMDLYSGAMHGFAVRPNVTVPQQRFAYEAAFIQAVRWFDFWAK